MTPQIQVFGSAAEASHAVAQEIAELIRERSAQGRSLVLGLATGGTPVETYGELVRIHGSEPFQLDHLDTVNLDELEGVDPAAPNSFSGFMRTHLFGPLGLDASRTHVPPAWLPAEDAIANAKAFEAKIQALGGIDLQLLGIGQNGHIGFNEPGSEATSRTRRVELDPSTRQALRNDFAPEATPRYAMTIGVETIFEARSIRLLALGESKAEAVRMALEEAPSSNCPASFLQGHADTRIFLDEAAASRLSSAAIA